MSLQFICAQADGVAPAALLTLNGDSGPQYLFNVPEGFSRLVLEHKIRPGSKLRCAFATHSPDSAMGGLPGLIMRLRQDGHEKLQVVGPAGMEAAVAGLQHFMAWQHPKVQVMEVCPDICRHAYQDEHISVLPLAGSPSFWMPPQWLQADPHPEEPLQQTTKPMGASPGAHSLADSAEAAFGSLLDKAPINEPGARGNGSGEPRRASHKVQDGVKEGPNGDSESSSSEDEGSSASSSDSESSRSSASDSEEAAHLSDRLHRIHNLDKILHQRGPSGRQEVLRALATAKQSVSGEGLGGHPRLSPPSISTSEATGSGTSQLSGIGGDDGWSSVPDCRNPVFCRPSAISKAVGASGSGQQTWGYLIHLAAGGAILVVDCPSSRALGQLKLHPVFQHIRERPAGLRCVLHFSSDAVARCKAYQDWIRTLPGKQVMMSGSGGEEGYLAASRTMARLNTLAPAIFPPNFVAKGRAGKPKEQQNGSIIQARMLMRMHFSMDSVELDVSNCPGTLDAAELQSQLLDDRPQLVDLIAPLKATSLWSPVPPPGSPSHRTPPPPRHPADSSAASPNPHDAPLSLTPPPTRPPPQQAGPRNRAQGEPAFRPSPQACMGGGGGSAWGSGPLPPAATGGCQIGQFAQVLRFGQPIGLVQLTLQGWVGPPELLRHLHATPADPGQPGPHLGLPGIQQPGSLSHPGPQAAGNCTWSKLPASLPASPRSPYPVPSGNSAAVSCRMPQKACEPPSRVQLGVASGAEVCGGVCKAEPGAGCEEAAAAKKRQKVEQASEPTSEAGKGWRAEDIDLPGEQEETDEARNTPVKPNPSSPQFSRCSPLLEPGGGTLDIDGVGSGQHIGMEHVPPYLQAMQKRGDPSQIRFLGTGCAEPSKYRGSSAIHLQTRSGWGLLMDAGEGAFGQMVKCYGTHNATKQVANLAAVFISHKHADHLLGLPGILRARPPSCPPLLVVGPRAAGSWLQEMGGEAKWRYHFLLCRDCQRSTTHPGLQRLSDDLGMASIRVVSVQHCEDAWALGLRHLDGWSVFFSGDTRPSHNVVREAKNCTLLIHEATFEHSMLHQAKQKRHSTSKEALEIARDCRAYRTVLTHFSQRYPKLPPGLDGPEALTAAVAFDGMCIPLTALPQLHRLLPLLHVALGELEDGAVGIDNKEDLGDGADATTLGGSGVGIDAEYVSGEDVPERVGYFALASAVPVNRHIRFED